MSRLFDAYVIANWPAAEGKKLGEQSLWIAVAKRDVRMRLKVETHNAATRAEGEKLLAEILSDLNRRGDRAMIGFDIPLGFPVGTAARLGVKDPTWSGLWAFLVDNVRDKPDNTNNRYQVAAKMNRLMTDQAWPFWGAPASQAQRWLTTTKPEGGYGDMPELRATETAARQGKLQPRTVWQMHGAGAVGGHALIGVPAVARLLDRLGPSGAVWPFGTGWKALTAEDVAPLSALVVEVWPPLFPAKAETGEFKTQAQVRVAAETFARMDEKGELAGAFAPPADAKPDLVRRVETEEGWILGVR